MVAHSEILLSKCAKFREEGEFIDVRLKVGEDVFPAHRIVLAANSDYFHAMFSHGMKESNQEVIELKDGSISAGVLKIVMDSIYSGDLHVNDENVFDVLLAADHLQVTSVVEQCCNYLQTEFVHLRFDVQTYCRISTIADRHGLADLQEALRGKMASMYKEVCESEEFLTHVDADQFSSLLSRDDLSAPSETFVFKSVMQWIKYKKEERMSVAAKVIGAVRLGLVDIREVIEELDTEEMQKVPEIHMLVYQSLLHNNRPSLSSKFALEKAKQRSTGPVLVAVLPQTQMQYFDVEAKAWKPLASLAPATEVTSCYCAETVGSELFVAGSTQSAGSCINCYDTKTNVWETHEDPHSCGAISNLCTVGEYLYAICSDCNQIPQRYSFAKRQWQSFAKLNIANAHNVFYKSGATVLHSKVYVLYGHKMHQNGYWNRRFAVLHCFDPVRNEWEEKALACHPHFGSSLFVVSNRLYVAGGKDSFDGYGNPCGNPASVEVYDEENDKWSVVEQKRIPQNNLGAVEIEGRVYFIINKFPFDSGIRIPPGEVYPVPLGEWKNLGNISEKAALCYLPFACKERELES